MGLSPNLSLDASQTTSESLAQNQTGGVAPGAISFGGDAFPQTPSQALPTGITETPEGNIFTVAGISFSTEEIIVIAALAFIAWKVSR